MYIPIVVAMAARQNVAAAADGGMLALVAGIAAVLVSFALVPVISRLAAVNEVPLRRSILVELIESVFLRNNLLSPSR